MEFINHKLNIKCYTCLNSTAWSLHVQAMDICLFYMNLLQLLHCDALRLRFICDAFPCTLTLASTVVKSGWKVLSRIYSRNMSTGYYGIYYPLRSDVRAHLHDISFWTEAFAFAPFIICIFSHPKVPYYSQDTGPNYLHEFDPLNCRPIFAVSQLHKALKGRKIYLKIRKLYMYRQANASYPLNIFLFW